MVCRASCFAIRWILVVIWILRALKIYRGDEWQRNLCVFGLSHVSALSQAPQILVIKLMPTKDYGAIACLNEVLGDLRDENTVVNIVNKTVAKFGGIDVLVNNAAMLYADPQHREGINQPIELFDKTFELNARSVLLITQLAAPHLERSAGSIVNVSAIAAQKFILPAMPYYGAAKAALDHLTVSMAGTFIKKGVRVNGVSPGIIETDFGAKAGIASDLKTSMYDKMANDKLAIPMGRVGRPADIANVILFLADSSSSAFILGQTIVADGGTSLNLATRTIAP